MMSTFDQPVSHPRSVVVPINSGELSGLRFTHWSTDIATPDLPDSSWESFASYEGALCGTTTWRAAVGPRVEVPGSRAGRWAPNGTASLKWGWVQLDSNVIVISDPLHIVSNMELVGSNGDPARDKNGSSLLLELNRVIHELRWQQWIQRSLAAVAAAASALTIGLPGGVSGC